MTSRALKLGDFGPSDAEALARAVRQAVAVHMVASIYADDEEHLKSVQTQVARAFTVLGSRDGRNLAADKVFFGFKDSISQPRFAEIRDDPATSKANEPVDPLGTVLLGYETSLEKLRFRVPDRPRARVQWDLQRLPQSSRRTRRGSRISHESGERTQRPSRGRSAAGAGRRGADRRGSGPCGGFARGRRSSDVRTLAERHSVWRLARRAMARSRSPRPISTTIALRDAPPARTCGASIRAAGRSCSGSPTTRGA